MTDTDSFQVQGDPRRSRPYTDGDVILLNDEGERIGTMPKSLVHSKETPLHLAFSVYAFRSDGSLLITRRSLAKRTWPGVWTNSCCGHVGPDEETAAAAVRRMDEELGLAPLSIALVLPEFRYAAKSPEGLVENELCPVFIAIVDRDPVPNPDEVVEWRWVSWDDFFAATRLVPWAISPWAALQVAAMMEKERSSSSPLLARPTLADNQ